MLLQTGDEKRWLADYDRALRPDRIDTVVGSTNRTERHWNRPIAGFFADILAAAFERAGRAARPIARLARQQPVRTKPAVAPQLR